MFKFILASAIIATMGCTPNPIPPSKVSFDAIDLDVAPEADQECYLMDQGLSNEADPGTNPIRDNNDGLCPGEEEVLKHVLSGNDKTFEYMANRNMDRIQDAEATLLDRTIAPKTDQNLARIKIDRNGLVRSYSKIVESFRIFEDDVEIRDAENNTLDKLNDCRYRSVDSVSSLWGRDMEGITVERIKTDPLLNRICVEKKVQRKLQQMVEHYRELSLLNFDPFYEQKSDNYRWMLQTRSETYETLKHHFFSKLDIHRKGLNPHYQPEVVPYLSVVLKPEPLLEKLQSNLKSMQIYLRNALTLFIDYEERKGVTDSLSDISTQIETRRNQYEETAALSKTRIDVSNDILDDYTASIASIDREIENIGERLLHDVKAYQGEHKLNIKEYKPKTIKVFEKNDGKPEYTSLPIAPTAEIMSISVPYPVSLVANGIYHNYAHELTLYQDEESRIASIKASTCDCKPNTLNDNPDPNKACRDRFYNTTIVAAKNSSANVPDDHFLRARLTDEKFEGYLTGKDIEYALKDINSFFDDNKQRICDYTTAKYEDAARKYHRINDKIAKPWTGVMDVITDLEGYIIGKHFSMSESTSVTKTKPYAYVSYGNSTTEGESGSTRHGYFHRHAKFPELPVGNLVAFTKCKLKSNPSQDHTIVYSIGKAAIITLDDLNKCIEKPTELFLTINDDEEGIDSKKCGELKYDLADSSERFKVIRREKMVKDKTCSWVGKEVTVEYRSYLSAEANLTDAIADLKSALGNEAIESIASNPAPYQAAKDYAYSKMRQIEDEDGDRKYSDQVLESLAPLINAKVGILVAQKNKQEELTRSKSNVMEVRLSETKIETVKAQLKLLDQEKTALEGRIDKRELIDSMNRSLFEQQFDMVRFYARNLQRLSNFYIKSLLYHGYRHKEDSIESLYTAVNQFVDLAMSASFDPGGHVSTNLTETIKDLLDSNKTEQLLSRMLHDESMKNFIKDSLENDVMATCNLTFKYKDLIENPILGIQTHRKDDPLLCEFLGQNDRIKCLKSIEGENADFFIGDFIENVYRLDLDSYGDDLRCIGTFDSFPKLLGVFVEVGMGSSSTPWTKKDFFVSRSNYSIWDPPSISDDEFPSYTRVNYQTARDIYPDVKLTPSKIVRSIPLLTNSNVSNISECTIEDEIDLTNDRKCMERILSHTSPTNGSKDPVDILRTNFFNLGLHSSWSIFIPEFKATEDQEQYPGLETLRNIQKGDDTEFKMHFFFYHSEAKGDFQ